MKYLKTFKVFESSNGGYAPGDIVTIRYWATGDIVPVKIISKKGNKYVVDFSVDQNPIPNAPNLTVSSGDIVGEYSLVNDPVTFRNPMNVPGDFIRRDLIRQSQDITINGYPKTLA